MKKFLYAYKFGNFLVLLFVLQINFSIKGSNAFPGNSHVTTTRENDLQTTDILPPTTDALNREENSQFDQLSTLNFEQHSLNEELSNVETLEIGNAKVIVPQFVPAKHVNIDLSNIDTNFDVAEQLGYSVMKSSFPLRPKSVSRQSNSVHSGELTPGHDFECIDYNSEYSSTSSHLAKLLFRKNQIVHEEKEEDIRSIKFDDLCEYLEITVDIKMDELELVLICKRIIVDSETYAKALKNLPFFINIHPKNENAKRINSILYSYLGQSGEEILVSDDDSLGSICCGRSSSSTIKTHSPSISIHCESPREEIINEIDETECHGANHYGGVLEEIKLAQAHVQHDHFQPSFNYKEYFERGNTEHLMCGSVSRPSFKYIHFRNLYPLMEEIKETVQFNENSDIEEFD